MKRSDATIKSVAMSAKCRLGQTSSPTNEDTKLEQVARWSVFPTLAVHKGRQSQWREWSEAA